MPQLLLELFSEEIPARMQAQAARDLERMAREAFARAGLGAEAVETHAGPRRLTLVARGLPEAQADRSEELKGPKVSAPPAAVEGFLKKTGLTRDQLTERDGVLFAALHRPGRPTPEIVAETVDEIVRAFPWPKSMRWGTGTLRWVRPLKRIVCLFDGRIVPFAVDGIESGDVTEGHRFMGSGRPFAVRDFDDYRRKLADEFVVLEAAERKRLILERARALCAEAGLELVEDEGLLEEVAGLAERPTPILGDMDPAFLDLPAEVIRTSMRTHQKYFAVRDPKTGRLAPRFVAVANIEASDGGKAVAAGNARVLSARLNDARFFWDEDRKVPLETRLEKLKGVTFHAKLGTMYERVERITALAREIAPLVGADPKLAQTAARLAKADLASGMVGEFPELQGIMGGYYARMEPYAAAERTPAPPAFEDGTEDPLVLVEALEVVPEAGDGGWWSGLSRAEVDQIADAVRDHYKPLGPSDTVPTAPVTVAVALADKLDTLVGFFAVDEKPTGSKDPFALRRAALGVLRLIIEGSRRVELGELIYLARGCFYGTRLDATKLDDAFNSLVGFLKERTRVALRDRGISADVVEACFARYQGGDVVLLLARVEALDGFLRTEDGANLLAGYKRAVNILKAEAKKAPGEVEAYGGAVDATLLKEAEEEALARALDAALAEVEPKLAAEDFTGAMAGLAVLRGPVDAFFERVLVNDSDPAVRMNRLRLLTRLRDAADRVADFGLISG